MRFKLNPDGRGYVMWLSARDTYAWAHKAGAYWPCSTLSDRRCVVVCDRIGLCDFTIDGKEFDDGEFIGDEISAIVADHLPAAARHLWPVWAAVPAVA
jgi:hypothetical protein